MKDLFKSFGRTISFFDKLLLRIEEFILSASVIIIFLMVIGNVLSRELFGPSIIFAYEVNRFAVIIATFMGISYAARKGRHISMSAFYDMAPFKVRKMLSIIIPAVTAIILLGLAYYSTLYVHSVYETGKVTPSMEVPAYLMSIFIPIGFLLGAIQYIRNMWINIVVRDKVYLGVDQLDYNDEPKKKVENETFV
ncbi:TRAP transporter small permease [Salirhabdus salicampi]|nr:TRAP transporter small permease [Salirhabdus salicampi]